MMRRLLLLLPVLLPWLALPAANAQSVPIKRGVITVDSAPSGDCSAVPGQVRRVRSTGETYVCEGGSWYRRDLPPCDPDPPSGSCSGNAVCLSESEASLYLCAGGSWQQVTGGGGGSGDMEKSTYDTDDDGIVDDAESLKGNPVNVDADADGKTDAAIQTATRRDTGVSSPCWDLYGPDTDGDGDPDPDGTCDLFFDPGRGIVTAGGSPYITGPVAIFTTADDVHSQAGCDDCSDGLDDDDAAAENLAWAIREAAAHGIPVGWPAQEDPDCDSYTPPCPSQCVAWDSDGDGADDSCGWGPRPETIQYAINHGQILGTHTATHCGLTLDTALLAGWSTQSTGYHVPNRAMWAAGGTVSVTEGSAWVTAGTGVDFNRHCFAPTESAPAHGFFVAIDCDKDGQMDFESWVEEVDEDGERFRMHDALPTDCDGDGTTGETIADLTLNDDTDRDWFIDSFQVAIRQGWRHTKYAYEDACEYLKDHAPAAADAYSCEWGARPGTASRGPFEQVELASAGIHWYFSGYGNTSFPSYREPMSALIPRISINCANEEGAIAGLMDEIIEGRGMGAFFGHIPEDFSAGSGNTCDPSGTETWSRQQYTEFLEKCQECMKEGTCVCADPPTAAKLAKLWGARTPTGENLLGNPDLSVNAKLGHAGANSIQYPQGIWPWYETTGGDFSGDDTSSIYYDESLGMTWIDPKDEASAVVKQSVRLAPGWYEFRVAARSEGIQRGNNYNGFYVKIVNKDASTSGADTAALRLAFPVFWYVGPHVEDGHGNSYDGFAGMGPVDNGSWFVNGDGIERTIYGLFWIPPELDGKRVEVQLYCVPEGEDRTNGTDDDGDGSIDEVERCAVYKPTLVKVLPEDAAAMLAHGTSVVPNVRFNSQPFSHLPGSHSAQSYFPAFSYVWAPYGDDDMDGDGAGDGLTDLPERDYLVAYAPTTGDTDFARWKVTGPGKGIFHGIGIAGSHDTSNNILFTHAWGDLDYDGTAIFEDEDHDGEKDANETYIGGRGNATSLDFDRDGNPELQNVGYEIQIDTNDNGTLQLRLREGNPYSLIVDRYFGIELAADEGILLDADYDDDGGTSTVTVTADSVLKLEPTDSPPACDSSTRGGLYYDDSLDELCYCDGTSWQQVDGGGGC